MDEKTEEALETLEGKKAGLFYDDSNMFYASKEKGWNISIEKLKNLFNRYCQVQFFNYYVSVPDKSDSSYKQTMRYLNTIEPHVTLKKKDLKYIKDKHGNIVNTKGDVDVEITVDAMEIACNNSDIEAFVIISGDSDFLQLKESLKSQGNLVLFVGFKSNMAWELREGWHLFLDRLKNEIVY